ncbi:TPA: glycopeptide resistance protein VanZ1 [Clostridioides difficile]|uniref:glycopeptide resistance protein VanZ1 n=1 Tax=Clostridioides difficile TaxID=1496 RepID=UPI00097FFB7E|nr:glycopeptide resistance protein VanZ1 [Clostridioides difficile]EJA6666105.1 glycopeptide resistance protein VanZ1 [Clostridioides difficile]MBH6985816.1 glycopeptide resistance protein VanZ1 [Clostridioides difficile]MBH7449787.1 glycopeptide resistance protein VanZ1 [Clostridioides difficile]MBY2556898.1 glycopeptide resistance protein VanZ1 [Clostridioides difficile]MBZ0526725.1 glycopeptide resistance protein VanZ1 [Clostridioides difficile]
MKSRKHNITKGLFIVYIIILTWIILFKLQFDISSLETMNLRSINLVPFAGSLIINNRVDISEIILNVAIFVPFGIYVCMLKEEWRFIKKVIPIFITSLAFETFQYIFALGASDITDLIGNTLGGIIGIAVFMLLSKIFKNNTIKIINVLALIVTIIVVLFLGLVIFANL